MKTTGRRRPKILLCVTGSVAAYKAAELARRLSLSAEVQALLTPAAAKLVRPALFRRASGVPTAFDLFKGVKPIAPGTPSGSLPRLPVPHIEYARNCDLVLVAPATADFLAKLAHGSADDLASSACLYASQAPLWAAPAMNPNMWRHPAVRANVETLRRRGVGFIGPDAGPLACGDEGLGRMSAPEVIARRVEDFLRGLRSWRGMNVLVTAGPTREPLDPVRVITNRSSGLMGYALAEAAARHGARVLLVSGPTSLPTPPGVRRLDVGTAREMHRTVLRNLRGVHLAVMTAAVADYRPAQSSPRKIKKGSKDVYLRLTPNPDILSDVLVRRKGGMKVVGFAAETDRLSGNARAKLARKPCDCLAANRVGAGRGMETPDNRIRLFFPGESRSVDLGEGLKADLASRLLAFLQGRFQWSEGAWRGHS